MKFRTGSYVDDTLELRRVSSNQNIGSNVISFSMESVSSSTSVQFSKRSILVDFLAVLFGISSWIEINGLWVEMPVLVQTLPERWNLASYIVIITQIANIGPILYILACRRWSSKILETPMIHITLATGALSTFLLIFLWSKTSFILGHHSTALLILAFLLALVDCTSSVLYLPFMAHYKEKYVVSLLLGEGLSGLLPSILALIQGVGGNAKCKQINTTKGNETITKWEQYTDPPLFSVEVFFVFLCGMMFFSWLAFILLQTLPEARVERVMSSVEINGNFFNTSETDFPHADGRSKVTSACHLLETTSIKKMHFIILLIFQACSCALTNGILPTVQTFSCLPYGNVAYHLAVTLSCMANPIACLIAMLFAIKKISFLSIYLTIGIGWACYIMSTAILSPFPPLVGTTNGEVLIVISWISFVGLLSYVKACIASILRKSGGHTALFWVGGVTQIGSATGALIMFILVNFTNIFKAYYPC